MKIKIVKTAKIECIKSHKLNVGDMILWSNLRCKVLSINRLFDRNSYKNFAQIQQFEDDPNSVFTIPRYSTFYRIIESETIDQPLCPPDEEMEKEENV